MKKLILIFCIINLGQISFAQSDFYFWGQKNLDYLSKNNLGISEKVLTTLDSIHSIRPTSYFLFSKGGKMYFLINCMMELYSIEGDRIKNEYRFTNQGYTCGARPFVRENSIYSLGGYGFWQRHSDLIEFDQATGSWEFFKTINQPLNYFSSEFFQNSKGIFVFFGIYYNPRVEEERWEYNGYFLDWKSKVWKKIEINIPEISNERLSKTESFRLFETKDFAIIPSITPYLPFNGWNIIEKETGKIFLYKTKNNSLLFSPFLLVKQNTITFSDANGNNQSIDFDKIKLESVEVGEIKVIENELFNNYLSYGVWIGVILLVSGFAFILLKKNYKLQRIVAHDSGELTNLDTTLENEEILNQNSNFLDLLTPYIGSSMGIDELDDILGLNQIKGYDAKRSKRSRIIREVNTQYREIHGTDLIIRERNSEDKRFYVYRIGK